MLRAGTLPTPLCAGLGEACRLLPDDRAVAEWRSLTLELEAGLQSLFPQMETIGNREDRHPGNLCVRIPGVDAERRSEERRVGKECVSTCRSRWSRYPYKTKTRKE